MNETNTSRPNAPGPKKPYARPTLISYGHMKDIVQTGGGGMSDGTDTSKTMCWVAEALYGVGDARTLALRSWLTTVHADRRRRGWMLVDWYRRFGQRVAALIRQGIVPRTLLLPMFNLLAEKAFDHSARTILDGRDIRTL